MKYDRLRNVEEYVLKKDFVSLDDLCSVFSISKNTIRRDVAELVKRGAVEKVYGGVRAAHPPTGALLSFAERTVKRSVEKQYIGKLASRFVEDKDVIFIDSGTTTLNILPHLADRVGVTVLTNNLHALNCCMELTNLNTICFGGQLSPGTAALCSNFCAIEHLKSFNINKAFMAATGVTIERGATNSTPGELVIKRSIVENSIDCILMADATKFGHTALLTYADLSTFQCVVTDRQPDERYRAYFEEKGIQLVVG